MIRGLGAQPKQRAGVLELLILWPSAERLLEGFDLHINEARVGKHSCHFLAGGDHATGGFDRFASESEGGLRGPVFGH